MPQHFLNHCNFELYKFYVAEFLTGFLIQNLKTQEVFLTFDCLVKKNKISNLYFS